MGAAYETINFKAEACDGCNACMTACAQAKAQSDDQIHSRIQIVPSAGGSNSPSAASAPIRNACSTVPRRRCRKTQAAA
jgi:phenylglyoxylate dehydrogenase beta subunit